MARPLIAASLLCVALVTVTAGPVSRTQIDAPTKRPRTVKCDNADYMFVLNLQRKDFMADPSLYLQRLVNFVFQLQKLAQKGMGVGVVLFSKKVEHVIPITRNMELFLPIMMKLLPKQPKFDGTATGNAMMTARRELMAYRLRLNKQHKSRKLLAVVAVSGDRNYGTKSTSAGARALHRVASHVFAVNLASGATAKELHQIASDGSRGTFNSPDIVDAASKTQHYAKVFCPCPASWTSYETCTPTGQTQVQNFFYQRAESLPYNCDLKSKVTFEPCTQVLNFHAVFGFDCVNSEFVRARSLETVFKCAEKCNSIPNCQAFSFDFPNRVCKMFVFNKCSKNVRPCICNKFAQVFIKKQPGLEPGALCPADFGHNWCGVKYKFLHDIIRWDSCRERCNAEPGLTKMTEPGSLDELSYLLWLYDNRHKRPTDPNEFFIGGNQKPGSAEPSGGWIWSTCRNPIPSSMWNNGEPNNSDQNENYLGTHRPGLKLNDCPITNPVFYQGTFCECASPFD